MERLFVLRSPANRRAAAPAFFKALLLPALLAVLGGCGAENPLQRGEVTAKDPSDAPPTTVCTPASLLSGPNHLASIVQQVECPTFSADVRPALQRCAGCHAGGAGGWTYDGGPQAYAQVIAAVDASDAAGTSLLLKATNQSSHGGGAQFSADSAEYDAILTWIASGAPND